MASSHKLGYLFFLLGTLIFSLQTHARDSQFFSKVTHNNNGAQETLKENEVETLMNNQEEQPTFIPQTTRTGYGLYGHETGLDPPSTTTTTTSATTSATTAAATSLYNLDGNTFENEKNYAAELKGLGGTRNTNVGPSKYHQGMSDTRFIEDGKYFYGVNGENKYDTNNYNYDNNEYYGNNYRENNYEFYNKNNENAMHGGYQNQVQDEEEFDFDP